MADQVYLPKDKQQREDVINHMVSSGKKSRHVKECSWWLAHHYLQGCRDFTNVSYENGTLDVNYINEDGVLRFRYDEIVAKFQAQLGRLMQVDLRPRVQRKSIGLEDLRKASTAQIVLDSALPSATIERLKIKMLPALCKYGCIALVVWNEGEDVGIDIAMPWEILPIPANPVEDKDVKGIMRVRTVPLDWVEKLDVSPKAGNKIYGEMKRVRVPVGSITSSTDSRFSTFGDSIEVTQPYGSNQKKKDETTVDAVELVEVWMETSTGHLATYDLSAGGKVIYTKDYAGNKTCMPITKINDINTGDFWGRSFVSLQIPLNTEIEYTLGKLFQNAQDLDTYGILCLPATLGIPPEVVKSTDGTKRVYFDPDYTAPDLKPFNIEPAKTGSFPSQVLQVGIGIADKLAAQPSALMQGDAPGRVDSQAGLGFLYETSNTTISPTANEIAIAMSNCYRAVLDTIAAGAWSREKLIQVTMLDDSLAGVTVDPSSGTMSLSTNVLPRPDEVEISVRSMLPRSLTQEKMEIMKSLEIGAIDMFEYRIEVRKRGLELPVGNEPEWQNYRRAMMENIMLFNDGMDPGQVIVDQYDMHEVHLRVLQGFMARPEFFQADVKVRDAFKQHYESHLLAMGNKMPDQAPYPEDMAQEEQIRQQQMQQMAQMGGQPMGQQM
jgi:hypothetical protein